MTINLSLNQLANLQNENTAVTQINQNSNLITTAFESALNTTGDQMQGTLDMNSNQVINLPTPGTANSPLRLSDLTNFQGGGTVIFPTIVGGTNISVPASTNATYTVSTITGPVFTSVSSTNITVSNTITASTVNGASGKFTVLSATTFVTPDGSTWSSGGFGSISPISITGSSLITLISNTSASISFTTAAGTLASPLAVSSNTILSSIGGAGYNGSGYTGSMSRILSRVSETSGWTASSLGTRIEFDTTASGSVTRAQAMSLAAGLYIGSATTDPGTGNLVAGGNITATGSIGAASGSVTNNLLVGTFTTGNALINGNLTVTGSITATGNITAATSNIVSITTSSPILLAKYTVTTLNAVSSPATGMVAVVTDALAPTLGTTLTGGGTVKILALYSGSVWEAV